jgi:Rrf2 family protein
MRLTRASSYALHAIVYLAAKKPNEPMPSHLVAQARGIPERFLLKVLKPLVSARLLLSVKGPNGGYRLAKPANQISMLEVVEAVDGPIRGYAPLSQNHGTGGLDRKFETICNQAADQIRAQLEKVRIADLAPLIKEKGGKGKMPA